MPAKRAGPTPQPPYCQKSSAVPMTHLLSEERKSPSFPTGCLKDFSSNFYFSLAGEQRNALLLSESRQLWLSKAMHLARISQHHLCLQPFGIVESLETY